jgi:hypothetical protein
MVKSGFKHHDHKPLSPVYFLSSGGGIYLVCGVAVCMSVWYAVYRGVYLICGVTVCMSVWCAVDRGVYLICGVTVCMSGWCAVKTYKP